MPPVIKKYSDKELDDCRFLHLIIATSGLDNPKEKHIFDDSSACQECKAGRKFIYPLIIPKNSMGKKKIDQNGRHGFLIFEKDLIEKFKGEMVKGIEFYPSVLGRNSNDFYAGYISKELPPMSLNSVVLIENECPICGRSGHYNYYDKNNEYRYKRNELDSSGNDFYSTWEYFGWWQRGENVPLIIISQKVRQILKTFKLKHLRFEPIFEE